MEGLKLAPGIRRAIILAAGRGTRLGELTRERPKCLVPVNGVPILTNALRGLADNGFTETVLVVGYRHGAVRDEAGERVGAMRVTYRQNPEYRTSGTSRSLWFALEGIDDDIVVLEGDVFFQPKLLVQLCRDEAPALTLVQRWNPSLTGSVVTLTAQGEVAAWLHENDRPIGFPLDGSFKTVNIHRFGRMFLREWLRPALARQVSRDGGREPLETVLAEVVRAGGRIRAIEAAGAWAEIDDTADLLAAERLFQGAPDVS